MPLVGFPPGDEQARHRVVSDRRSHAPTGLKSTTCGRGACCPATRCPPAYSSAARPPECGPARVAVGPVYELVVASSVQRRRPPAALHGDGARVQRHPAVGRPRVRRGDRVGQREPDCCSDLWQSHTFDPASLPGGAGIPAFQAQRPWTTDLALPSRSQQALFLGPLHVAQEVALRALNGPRHESLEVRLPNGLLLSMSESRPPRVVTAKYAPLGMSHRRTALGRRDAATY